MRTLFHLFLLCGPLLLNGQEAAAPKAEAAAAKTEAAAPKTGAAPAQQRTGAAPAQQGTGAASDKPPGAPTDLPAPKSSVLVRRYWSFHKWAALGYRYDRQRFNEYLPDAPNTLRAQTTFHGRSTVTLKAGSHMQYKSVVLGAHGGYGWLVHGNMNYINKGNGENEPFTLKNVRLGAGYTADAQASVGWEWPFYKGESFGFSVIPGAGYRYSHIMNWPSKDVRFEIPATPVFLPAGTSGEIITHYPQPNEQDWFGPFIDARLRFKFWETGQLDLYYQCHFLNVRSKTCFDRDTYTYNPADTLVSAQRELVHSVIKSHTARTQLGGAEIRIHHASGWTFGIYGEGSITSTNKASNSIRYQIETNYPAPQTTVNLQTDPHEEILWVNYGVSIFMGYKF